MYIVQTQTVHSGDQTGLSRGLGPLLLAWINFNPIMDK